MFSTLEGYHEYIRDIMSTSGDVQYIRGISMIYVGKQHGKILSISIENPDVLNIPQCTHDIPPMYS